MTYCAGGAYIQTLTTKFSNYESLRITKSINPTGSSCTFTVKNVEGSSDNVALSFPTIVSVHGPDGTKVFAGYATSYSRSFEGKSETISCTFPDFAAYFAKLKVIRNYTPESELKIADHVANLLEDSGAYDPDADFNPVVSTVSGADAAFFYFNALEIYLEEALNQLCQATQKRWYMGYGGWDTIDALIGMSEGGGGSITDLYIVDATGGSGDAPIEVRLPFDSIQCDEQGDIFGVSYTANWADVITRVIVLGKGADFGIGNIGQQTKVDVHDILPDSEAKHFPLNDFAIAVTQVEMRKVAHIVSLSPDTGIVGTPVTIEGTNLSNTTQVFFNGTPVGGFIVVDDTTVTTDVPAGATTGKVQVSTSDAGDAYSAIDFTVT